MAVSVVERQELKFADENDDMGGFPLRPGLSWRDSKQAEMYRAISIGTMLIYGERRSGKDMFGISTAYLNKYYFGRPILLDFLPKQSFGEYTLFNAKVMMQEIRKMAKKAGVEGIENTKDQSEYDQFVTEHTVKWATEGEGLSLFQNAVLYLSELKRYCHNRNPHNRFNKFVGSLNTIVGHLNMLIMGTHVFPGEIDVNSYLNYANIRAHCRWLKPGGDTTQVDISCTSLFSTDGGYTGSRWLLRPLLITGNLPLDCLDGKTWYDCWKSKNAVNLMPVLSKEM